MHAVSMPLFLEYLEEQRGKSDTQARAQSHAVGKALGGFRIQERDGSYGDIRTPAALVGILSQDKFTELMRLPIYDPKFTWTRTTLEGFPLYCEYVIRDLARMKFGNVPGPWHEYEQAILGLKEYIKGGFANRCKVEERTALEKKKQLDLKAIRNLPAIRTIQNIVREGYIKLRIIEEHYKDTPLPISVRAEANRIVCSSIYLDTFGGRKLEWEILEFAHVWDQLERGKDFIICSTYKTSKTYGDLAKYLSPGLRECFRCYCKLHRPKGWSRFLVPAMHGSKVDIPSTLRNFARKVCLTSQMRLIVSHSIECNMM